ncbi:MAG: hypothetical protein ACOCQ4_03310 [bacterium]
MSDERQFEYHLYSESTQKFDYYVAGLAATFSAFFVYNIDSVSFGYNPSTIEFVGVIFLIVSLGFALLRIERWSTIVRLNHERNECLRSIRETENMKSGQKMKHQTEDRAMNNSELCNYKQNLKETSEEIQIRMDRHRKIAILAYSIRNVTLFCGLIFILFSKTNIIT